ncbi:MAG TPA: SGNH/GDSL hydrolase family protein [Candidatus Limivicinus faecipullorum]|nr:SGNH/GDSL hydrolase family protein [Candidatus Limivicinus faecipullorum]
MNNGISGLKNIIWAFAIVVSLAALVIGLIVTMVLRYNGEAPDGTMYLGDAGPSSGLEDPLSDDSGIDGGQSSSGGLMELPNSQDTGLEYLFNLSFLCDNSFSAVNSFGANFGSTASSQVWLPAGGTLAAANASSTSIIYPQDGSEKTPGDAAGLYEPSRLVIYLGSDQLSGTTAENFISGYTALIQSVQSSSPNTKIICCSIGSVTAAYAGSDGLSSELIAQANDWIKQVCTSTGVYYADLASVLNDDEGHLIAEYAAEEGRSISAAGINKVMDYFRMHGI